MSETAFPVNDLIRRRFQTSIIIISIALSIGSTVFLLLFGDKMGFGVLALTEGRLTTGFAIVFAQFTTFVEILMFIVGAVMISFLAFVMMSQRVKDVGLMKATGCPNELTFGFFMNELLLITLAGCITGSVAGVAADFASTIVLSNLGFQIPLKPFNFWLVLLVFAVFFVFGLVFGLKPVLNATKLEPAKALSPSHYLGLSKEPGFRPLSRSGVTAKIALRSLSRRKAAAFRIVACMIGVFLLVTVAVAGGIISNQTSGSWVERAIGRNTILIAHHDMVNQYRLLLSKFYESTEESAFNYTNEEYLIPESLLTQLNSTQGVADVDARLVLETDVREIRGYILELESGATKIIGDNRTGRALVVGLNPERAVANWSLRGQFFSSDNPWGAVVGDELAQTMFTSAIDQEMMILPAGTLLDITGVCLDPINNGNVTYMPLKTLQSVMKVSGPNIVMVSIDASVSYKDALNRVNATATLANPNFEILELNQVLNKSLGFLDYLWSAVMLLPLLSLIAASLCLIGYVMLTITEESQEFGVLRALGAKPRSIVNIVSLQNLVILLPSCGAGVGIGIMLTLMILMPEPVVTSMTVAQIAGWLLIALLTTFLLSLYPAVRFAKKRILETMT